MKILHISDLHFGQPQAASRASNVIQALLARPDLATCVLNVGGDTLETPSWSEVRTAYAMLRPLFDQCRAAYLIDGNHCIWAKGALRFVTIRGLFEQLQADLRSRVEPETFLIQGKATRVIPASTTVRPPGWRHRLDPRQAFAQGYLGEEQIRRIAAEVAMANAQRQRSVILMHHCPTGGSPLLRLMDREALGEALEGAGGASAILSGHLHARGLWRDEYGADFIVASPKSQTADGYWEIGADGESVVPLWVPI